MALVDTSHGEPSTPTPILYLLSQISAQDVDDSSLLLGAAIVGAVGSGSWQHSCVGPWVDFPELHVSSQNALLLGNYCSLRYVPNDINGETASVSFHAWDQSQGRESGTIINLEETEVGGATPFSDCQNTAVVNVASAPSTAPTESLAPSSAPSNCGEKYNEYVSRADDLYSLASELECSPSESPSSGPTKGPSSTPSVSSMPSSEPSPMPSLPCHTDANCPNGCYLCSKKCYKVKRRGLRSSNARAGGRANNPNVEAEYDIECKHSIKCKDGIDDHSNIFDKSWLCGSDDRLDVSNCFYDGPPCSIEGCAALDDMCSSP